MLLSVIAWRSWIVHEGAIELSDENVGSWTYSESALPCSLATIVPLLFICSNEHSDIVITLITHRHAPRTTV
ncbi:hypothetical protein WG66_008798 [Moniliophthora roreri]|nr:hypothetical protein WG66_008798 [Moniliophthora roreri]